MELYNSGQTMEPNGLAQQFAHLFGTQPVLSSAPGRVNLIGEHTDYNQGFVLPSAIDFRTRVAISSRPEPKLLLQSREFPQHFEFDLDKLPRHAIGNWCDYVLGIAVGLQQAGYAPPGANLLLQSEIPIGSGLSSSAGVEVASALALLCLMQTELPLIQVAKLCQNTENAFIGARVGIMDQFISCMGKAGNALLLDCRSLESEFIPIPDQVRMVVCNTMVKHSHASGEYNRRRAECEEAVKILARWYPDIRSLRDLSIDQLSRHAQDVPEKIYRRCQHVVEENERVCDGARRLRADDLNGFGELMRASHRSLRDLYEVSCRELDIMVEVAEGLPGYYGGRMTGGGFGGSTINLVEAVNASTFADQVADRYHKATGIIPDVYICTASDGARIDYNGRA